MGRSGVSGPFVGSYFCFSATARLAISLTNAVIGSFTIPARVSFRISEIDLFVPQAPADLTLVQLRDVIGGTLLLAANISGLGDGETALCLPSGSVAPAQNLAAAQRTRLPGTTMVAYCTTPATVGTYEIGVQIHGYYVAKAASAGEEDSVVHINVEAED